MSKISLESVDTSNGGRKTSSAAAAVISQIKKQSMEEKLKAALGLWNSNLLQFRSGNDDVTQLVVVVVGY